jgi:hypothetical protein
VATREMYVGDDHELRELIPCREDELLVAELEAPARHPDQVISIVQ